VQKFNLKQGHFFQEFKHNKFLASCSIPMELFAHDTITDHLSKSVIAVGPALYYYYFLQKDFVL
jgi:hypothetical protein